MIGCDLFYVKTLISVFFYFLDVGTDVNLAIRYYDNGDVWWCGWTATFVSFHWIWWLVVYRGGRLILFCGNEGEVEKGKKYVTLPLWPLSLIKVIVSENETFIFNLQSSKKT